jgi:hypothetical protein
MTQNNAFKKKIRARMSVTNEKYSVAKKRLQKDFVNLGFDDFFSSDQVPHLDSIMNDEEHSIVLFTSPSGAGKSALMESCFKEYFPSRRRIFVHGPQQEMVSMPSSSGDTMHTVDPDDNGWMLTQATRMRCEIVGHHEYRDHKQRAEFLRTSNLVKKLMTTLHTTIHDDFRMNTVSEMHNNLAGIVQSARVKVNHEESIYINSVLPFDQNARTFLANRDDTSLLEHFKAQGLLTLSQRMSILQDEKIITITGSDVRYCQS